LCRNNAPLINLAFGLIRNRRGFTFFGQNMAKNLKGLIKKVAGFAGQDLRVQHKQIPAEKVLTDLAVWYESERVKLEAKQRTELLGALIDRRECAKMILEESKTLGEALDMCDRIFNGTGDLTLSSGHRSKGFEWHWVMHLDPFRIPSKYAVEAMERGDIKQITQENNLRYVIETRTKHTLVMARLRDNEDSKGVEGDVE
jgi:superfamily I DNA/RNA helicase